MCKALIFGGTTEGRLLYEYCMSHEIPAVVSVATAYGEEILDREGQQEKRAGKAAVSVHTGRLCQEEIQNLLRREEIALVLDATHPYAVLATENIRCACRAEQVPYQRIVREEQWEEGMLSFGSIGEAVAFLQEKEGSVFVTTGSSELQRYTILQNYRERIYARVLPDARVVFECTAMGIEGRHLIAMQGPFSEEMNYTFLKEFGIRWMVTKQSGLLGGFPEKWRAAKRAGADLLVVRRQKPETGISVGEAMGLLEELK